MKSNLDHERTLNWYKKPMRSMYELKESPRDHRVLASLKVSRLHEKGRGTYNGKNVEMSFVHDGTHHIVPIIVEGNEGEWGHFRGRSFLHDEPAVLTIHDGREYCLKQTKWDKFKLYTKDEMSTTNERIVGVTTMDRSGFVTKMKFEVMNATEVEKDLALLALVSFLEVLWFNRQTS